MSGHGDIHVETSDRVATIEIRRPPLNFFDVALIRHIADALAELDEDAGVRSVVLAARGKAFCAGAEFAVGPEGEPVSGVGEFAQLYIEAARIFRNRKPIVAAVHGAAIGGGLGLAMAADFRVTCPEARFAANFTKLGLHPGFGLTVTLPDAIGKTEAALMFCTSRRIGGEQAVKIGLASVLAPQDQVRVEALKLAAEIAECSPLGVGSTRDAAPGPRGAREGGHRSRTRRADLAARDGGLSRRRPSHARTPDAEFPGAITTCRGETESSIWISLPPRRANEKENDHMHFVVHCLDHEGALQKRLAHYEAHKAHLATVPFRILVSGPLLADDNETMIGSMFLFEADDRAVVEAFNAADPFREAGVWERIDIHPFLKRTDNR